MWVSSLMLLVAPLPEIDFPPPSTTVPACSPSPITSMTTPGPAMPSRKLVSPRFTAGSATCVCATSDGVESNIRKRTHWSRLSMCFFLCVNQATTQNFLAKPVERTQHKSQTILILIYVLRQLGVNASHDNLWPHHKVRLHGDQRLSKLVLSPDAACECLGRTDNRHRLVLET